MPTPQFYPALNKLVSSDKLPEPFKAIVENISDKLFYKAYYVEKSLYGEAAYHHIILVFNKEIGFNLFGGEEGFEILFNPGSLENTTELPLAIYYNLPILKYIRQVKMENLNSVEDYFDLILEMFEISKQELLLEAINVFFNGYSDPINAFVTEFNTNPDYSSYPALVNTVSNNEFDEQYNIISDIVSQFEEININIHHYLVENYINLSDLSTGFENLTELFKRWLGEFSFETFINLFIPKFSVSIQQLELALAFPRTWLQPVDANGEVNPDTEVKSMLRYNAGSLSYHSEKGLEFNDVDDFTLDRSQIGNTGLIIEIDELKFDFRSDRNIPEATADGRPDTFKGIYADKIGIILPKKWFNNVDNTTLQVAGYNMLIGTGGVSGTIALETVASGGDGYMPVNIGNWEVGFNHFDMTFKQNAIIESHIAGRLKIPKLKDGLGNDAEILINGHLNEEGDFNLTASEPEGIPFNLFNFVTINFLSIELGKEEGDFYIGTSCEIWFENAIMKKILDGQKIVIPRLRVYDNGTIEIVGGNSFIPTNISLNLGPVEIAVTGIHFGAHQQEHNGVMRKYNYWGFDGAISLDPLGIDARGEGIKYYYTVDNDEKLQEALNLGVITQQQIDNGDVSADDYGDSFLRIQTIEVDLIIPGTASPESAIAIIHGMVSIPEPGESPEYIGEVSLKLPKAKIAGGAAMRLQPKHPAFLVDAYVDLPAPIPIGPLGIYGFRGLLGFRYVAEKEAVGLVSGEDTWYDYYTYPPKGVHHSKFSGPERTGDYDFPFSVGAGAVLGTSFDSGTIISVRAMLLLSLPTLFLVEGKASILSARLGLDDNREPPFFAFVAWGDNSIEMGMGADFQLPQGNGSIINLYAEVQAGFFFNNPRAWYVNFGTRDVPITARVLTIITAQSYLMLSATGIEAGARVEFDLRKRFGPAKVHIYAYLEMGGFISFERPQIGGYIALGGMIDIDIWIVGVTIGLDAIFSVEAAKPFLIYAEVRLRVCVKIVFARVCKSFTVKLKWEKNGEVDRIPIPALPYQNGEYHADRTKELVQAVHMLTNESFEVNYLGVNISGTPNASQITKIIPLDTYIDIKTVKGLIPGEISDKIGGHTGGADNFTDLIPPQRVVRGGRELRQVKHKYSIEDIEIKALVGTNWVDYHPYEALVKEDDRSSVNHLRIGYWQRTGNQYDAIRLLATNPFSYTEAGEPGWMIPEQYGITPSELFCQSIRKDFDCANVLNKELGTTYYPPTQYTGHYINGAYFTLDGHYETTVTINPDGTQTVTVSEDNFRVVENVPPINFNCTDANSNPIQKSFNKSLEFDNGNSLVIILPEPSVEVKLKLTANSAGALIKYYSTERIENYNPVYQLIEEQFYSPSQLQDAIQYKNEENYITKVVIDPTHSKCIGKTKDVKYSVLYNRAGIFTNQELSYKRELLINSQEELDHINQTYFNTGVDTNFSEKSILFLALEFNEDRFVKDFIVDEVYQKNNKIYVSVSRASEYTEFRRAYGYFMILEIEKVSDVELVVLGQDLDTYGYDSSPCTDKDEKICNTHDKLLQLYQECFVPVQTNAQVDANISCFQDFRDIVKFDISGEYSLNEGHSISIAYESYVEILIPIIDLQGHHEQIIRFGNLKQAAQELLDLINDFGNCDCIDDSCSSSLQEICWMTLENHEFNLTIPGQDAVEQEQQDMVDAIQKTVQPIWRPNTKYYVRFRLKDDVDNGENEGLFDYYYGFKTVGPVGHYHKHSSVDYVPADANPDQYPLTSLRQYIDYNRSYPNADGNLLQAKPLFYGHNQCKITVYFSKPLTYHMLNKWHNYNGLPELAGSMHIAIKDPVTEAIIPYPFPVGYSEDTVPTGQTFATWLEFNSAEELDINLTISIIDVNSNIIGDYTVLRKDYLNASNKYHIRIDDEALLSDNTDLVGGKIKWNSFDENNLPITLEFEIIELGSEDANWNIDNNPRLPMNLQLLNNMVNHINDNNDFIKCDLQIGQPIIPNSYAYTVTLTNLKPRKLYTALLYNAFDKNSNGSLQDTESEEVHQFVFQTSRYQNFEAQVKSYWLRELGVDGTILNERQAVFEIPLALSTAEINTAYNIVAGVSDANSDALELQYYHLFDRATEGVLGFNPVDPPENTEFNVLKNTNTGKTIGVLIRNPEPFNIPKINLETIKDTIAVVFASSGAVNNAYKVLYSKDYSQALIMHSSKEITNNTLNFRFQYKTWNGSSYEVSDTVVIENIQLT